MASAKQAKLCFYSLGGNSIDLLVEPSSVAEARHGIAEALGLEFLSQVVLLLPDGEYLEDSATLPSEGVLQVQKLPPPEGTWSRNRWDAENFDEEALRNALSEAFPSPHSEMDYSVDPPAGWRPAPYWSDDEKWARWASKKMQQATLRTVGEWADYWEFGEMGDSYGYWMVEAPYRSKQETIESTVANVKHWRSLLHDLHSTFVSLKNRSEGIMSEAEKWEIVAAELLKYSPSLAGCRTSFKYGFETWYQPFLQVMKWYANFADLDATNVENYVHGVFRSYSVRADGAMKFAEAMASYHGIEFKSLDATAQWLHIRPSLAQMKAKSLKEVAAIDRDAHLHHISTVDLSRSPERAERMKAALHMVRSDTMHKRLTLELLSGWNAVLLGLPSVTIRKTDAYAKEGRERYPHAEDLSTRFGASLLDASDQCAPEVKAVRAYLDVCFYHPFDDGNARLARLVLDFILTKAGLCLEYVGGLFSVSRKANDKVGAKAFVETLQQCLAPMGPRRDDDLKAWSNERDESLLQMPPQRRKYDGSDYEWFDCVTSDALLDREFSTIDSRRKDSAAEAPRTGTASSSSGYVSHLGGPPLANKAKQKARKVAKK